MVQITEVMKSVLTTTPTTEALWLSAWVDPPRSMGHLAHMRIPGESEHSHCVPTCFLLDKLHFNDK
jgi:hypothetical protein